MKKELMRTAAMSALIAAAAAVNICAATEAETEMQVAVSAADETETEAVSEGTDSQNDAFAPVFCFETTTLGGEEATEELYKDASLVMINFWEPWCGPCVQEMPDLEELYETYAEDGLQILGVFCTTGMDEDAQAVIEDLGTTYPILHGTKAFVPYMTEYVPTTVFLDGNGNLLSETPVVGAQRKEDWETMITEYLTEMNE